MTFFSRAVFAAFMVVGAALSSPGLAQPVDPLARVAGLAGDWIGAGEGEPGTSVATRHVERIQAGRFVQIQGRSVYAKQPKNPSGEVHTSLDLWSYDKARKRIVLRQFDSLGFVSTYVEDPAAGGDRKLVLVSESLENVPAGWRARYAYEFVGPDEYREHFELDPDGKGLHTYVLGRYLRDRSH